jgi:4-hydroxy-3-methylbut-2-en-1-yl diphosphate synthase IspG/GcpE
MKTKKNCVTLFLLALGFFVVAHAQAQVDSDKAAIDALNAEAQKKGLERASQPTQNVAQPQVLATVSIQNAKLEKQTTEELIMTFDLNNRDLVQPNIKYAVKVVDQADGKNVVVDLKTYDESVTIAANETISKKISYPIPPFIKG